MGMSKKIHKSCSPLCEICGDLTLGCYVLDDYESACYWDDINITSGVLSFMSNGYLHTVLKSKKKFIRDESTVNLLNETTYNEHMFDLLENIDDIPDTI